MLSNIKQFTKRIIYFAVPQSFAYRQGDNTNILLMSSRRGGSTFLAGLIASEPGMRYVDQPFDLTDSDSQKRKIKELYLPRMDLSQFINLSETDEEKALKYMRLLLSGRLRQLGEPYIFPKNRTIIKDCDSLPLIDWFADNFNVSTVYLTRHPIPQSLSVVRTRWAITARAYLENPHFSRLYLSESQLQRGYDIMEKGTSLEKAVLNWILENLYPLKFASKIDFCLTYEELTLFPDLSIKLLTEKLNLLNNAGMHQKIDVPSWSRGFSELDTNEAIRNSNRIFLVSKWLSKVDEPAIERIQEILDVYSIDEYNTKTPLPNKKLCHFYSDVAFSTI